MKKVYNINFMRSALVASRENGNRKVISAKLCEELNIEPTWFTCYVNLVNKLYDACTSYIRVKHDQSTTDELRNEAREKLFPIWKELLACGEKDQFSKSLRVSPADIDSIIGYAEKFVLSANNLDFVDGFVAPKVIATETKSKFRRDVETLLGIRIAQVEVLTDRERDLLAIGRKLTSRKNRIETAKKNALAEIVFYEGFIKRSVDNNMIKEFEAIIKSKKGIVESCDKEIANVLKDIQKLKDGTFKLKSDKKEDKAKADEDKAEDEAEASAEFESAAYAPYDLHTAAV